MNSVPSCPALMLKRIEVAKLSIQEDKERAKKQRREYFPVFCPIGFTEYAIRIFERLACDPNMQDVWEALSTVFDDTKRPPDTWAFADFCYHNMGVWKFSPKRTRTEHRKHFEKIANDLMDVVGRIVCEPEFGAIGQIGARVSPVDMARDDMLEWLLEDMHAAPIDGQYIKTQKEAISNLRSSLSDVMPDLYRYAEWIAAEARRIAAQPSISERPHRATAQRTFFVKHLSKWFRERFHGPKHEVVAGVASALFGAVVTADDVRKAVKTGAEVSIPFRRGKLPLPE